MKNQQPLMTGVLLCLTLVVIYTYLIVNNIKHAATTSTTPTIGADPSMFDSPVFSNIGKKNMNGQLPITLNAGDIGHPNPYQ